MEEIRPSITNIKFTTQPNGYHHLVLITSDAINAQTICENIGSTTQLLHPNDWNNMFLPLLFHLIEMDKSFRANIPLMNETAEWLDWLNQGTVTHLDICYPNDDQLPTMCNSIPIKTIII